MKRDFDVQVFDYDGKPHVRAMYKFDEKTGVPVMKNGQQEFDKHVPMMLRTYALDALCGRWPKDIELNVDGGPRMKLYHKICFTKGLVDLDAQEPGILLQALEHQGRSYLVIDAMQRMLSQDPEPVLSK